MAEPELRRLPEPERLPERITVDPKAGFPPHSPRETIMLEEMSGKRLAELVADDSPGGLKECVLVWFTLRRLGFSPSWDDALDMLVDYETPDPTSGGTGASSPPSVTTGE